MRLGTLGLRLETLDSPISFNVINFSKQLDPLLDLLDSASDDSVAVYELLSLNLDQNGETTRLLKNGIISFLNYVYILNAKHKKIKDFESHFTIKISKEEVEQRKFDANNALLALESMIRHNLINGGVVSSSSNFDGFSIELYGFLVQ